MDELQKALGTLEYFEKKFPSEAFRVIRERREEAIPYLRQAVEKAIKEQENLKEGYQLHFYAVFLLGEFQDRQSFPKLLELAALPIQTLDYLFGDAVIEGLPDILYNTYNEDINSLKDMIGNREVNEYVRSGLIKMLGQLYLDGKLAADEWINYVRENIYQYEENSGEDADEYICSVWASTICDCHTIELLPEIRYLYERNLLDTQYMGEYDSHVDAMFQYREWEKDLCKKTMDAETMLSSWSMYNEETKQDPQKQEEGLMKLLRQMEREEKQVIAEKKPGRNDPCPCGSGKKYKLCCLNAPRNPLDAIESAQERKKWLNNYPQTGGERQTGRIYLEDYYDADSIEIDKILYLGLRHRHGLIWLRDKKKEAERTRRYLCHAYHEFCRRAEEMGIETFEEYDKKYSIHYTCKEWMDKYMKLLQENNDEDICREVEEVYHRMK